MTGSRGTHQRSVGQRVRAMLGRWLLVGVLDRSEGERVVRDFEELGASRGQVRPIRNLHFLAELVHLAVGLYLDAFRRGASDALGHARRVVWRSPAFAITASVTLALGIGAATSIYSVVHTVLLAALPYEASEQLVEVSASAPGLSRPLSVVDLEALRAQLPGFESLGAVLPDVAIESSGATLERVRVSRATVDFLSTVGIEPQLGRGFHEDDGRQGQDAVALISHKYWLGRFAGDVNAVGQQLVLDGETTTIVGVLPPDPGPIGSEADVWPVFTPPAPTRNGPFGLQAVARLNGRLSAPQLEARLSAVMDGVLVKWPGAESETGIRYVTTPLRDRLLGDVSRPLFLLLAAVSVLLLTASANVASLFVARGADRAQEMAIRTALGASGSHLVGSVVSELVVVLGIGAAGGWILARLGIRALTRLAPETLPRLDQIEPNAPLLVGALTATLVIGLLSGILPTLHARRYAPVRGIGHGTRTNGGPRRSSARRLLVAFQFALALPLLHGTGLLLNSFARLLDVDPGFEAQNLTTMHVALPPTAYANPDSVHHLWQSALEALEELPGVERGGLGSGRPPDFTNESNNFDLVSRPVGPEQVQPSVPFMAATPGYFDAIGVRLVRGRLPDSEDVVERNLVLVVDQAFADRFLLGSDVLGERMYTGGCIECGTAEIVGIVSTVSYDGIDHAPRGAIYYHHGYSGMTDMYLFVRTAPGVTAVERTVAESLRDLEPGVVVSDVESGPDLVARSVGYARYLTTLLGAFAFIAIMLAVIGAYGMLSYFVAQSTHEIGVRVALGAQRTGLMRLVIARGLKVVAVGVGAGFVLTIASSRALDGLLYGIAPMNAVTWLATGGSILIVALSACALPAWRAARLEKVSPLRAE